MLDISNRIISFEISYVKQRIMEHPAFLCKHFIWKLLNAVNLKSNEHIQCRITDIDEQV